MIKDYNAREALDIQFVAVIVVITVVILIWCDWLSYLLSVHELVPFLSRDYSFYFKTVYNI